MKYKVSETIEDEKKESISISWGSDLSLAQAIVASNQALLHGAEMSAEVCQLSVVITSE